MKSSSSIIAVLFPFLLITSYTFADDDWTKRSNAPQNTAQFKVGAGIDNGAEVQFVVSADGAGLFKSTDDGLNWENIGLVGKSLRSMTDKLTIRKIHYLKVQANIFGGIYASSPLDGAGHL